jgi:Fe-S oxidoreductase
MVGEHIWWWLALGSILLFLPYFLYSKHIHLFFAPFNFLLHPERPSMGTLDALDFEDEAVEQFGVARLEDLSWKGLMDAYACIMCNRCQDACPAYETGKVLSPAALEVNKRYFLNQEGARIAAGEASSQTMLEFAITPEAVWACTACGACVEVCPVGNEPMRDILEIRQNLVLMENEFPEQLQTAFRGMERTANPWNIPAEERLKWAEGLDVPTIQQNPEPEILWWVGCAPATDARAQRTAQAFAKVLIKAGVNFAVLGTQENCTGDSATAPGTRLDEQEMSISTTNLRAATWRP